MITLQVEVVLRVCSINLTSERGIARFSHSTNFDRDFLLI